MARIISSPQRDSAATVDFARLVFRARQPKHRTDGFGFAEARGHVDRRSIGQRYHRADTRDRHQTPAHLIIAHNSEQAAMVMVLPRRSATKAVKARLKAQGINPSYVPARNIAAMAKEYLLTHKDELLAHATAELEAINGHQTGNGMAPRHSGIAAAQVNWSFSSRITNTRRPLRRQSQGKLPMPELVPSIENRTLPRRKANSTYRPREYLTESEVDRLIEAARKRGR